MNALRLQVETYRKIENQENINEEELANVIMDRGYTESLLDAISDDYSVSRLDEGQPPPTPPYKGYSMHTNSLTIFKGKHAPRFDWVLGDWGPFYAQMPSQKLTLKSSK